MKKFLAKIEIKKTAEIRGNLGGRVSGVFGLNFAGSFSIIKEQEEEVYKPKEDAYGTF